MNRKAQVTTFIILGVIIIAIVAIGIYFRSAAQKTAAEKEAEIAKTLPDEIAEIRKTISECVQFTLEDAVAQAGLFGGFTEPQEGALFTGNEFVNYGYANKKKALPTLLEMQENMAAYINEFLPECIFLESDKMKITLPEPKASVTVLDKKVAAEVEYSVVIKSGDNTYTMSDPFAAETAVRLRQIHGAAAKTVGRAAEKPEHVNIEYLLTLGEEIDVIPFDEKNVIYRIPDKDAVLESSNGDVAFTFIFATKA